jgi:hypothetical protein
MQSPGFPLSDRIANGHNRLADAKRSLSGYQHRMNAIALEFYGIEGVELQVLKEEVNRPALPRGSRRPRAGAA